MVTVIDLEVKLVSGTVKAARLAFMPMMMMMVVAMVLVAAVTAMVSEVVTGNGGHDDKHFCTYAYI